ncbi:RNA polymerase sigma factor/ sigma-70 family protein [Synechococcus sp. SYN20]|uniref:sigma-70 family RNA polymerase sigma factor n=1 Tax=Synechococcus sp. SYN20 TaxID=1050714 RepID=UPI001645207B|nr:sigma-70 family RNA polymerase sigma factor [Synechococcus sp. SYN20]QNJ25892.1 RNA polymerase sigma factor/ sigma-70 family protein [Synechococcus sp. SYN20]
MATDSLSCWLDAAGRFPLLTTPQVIQLSRLIQEPTTREKVRVRAIDRLICCNLRLVAKIWRSQFAYVKPSEARVTDLLQEGTIGLRRAAEKYDYRTGYTFATYAINWIRKEMFAYLRDRDRNIRISADCFAVVNTARKFVSHELARTGQRPSMEAIAAKVKKPLNTVDFFFERYLTTSNSSLNRPTVVKGDDVGQLQDIIMGRADYDLEMDAKGEKLRQILEILMDSAGFEDKDRALVIARNCQGENPRTYASIGRDWGMNPAYARNHHERLIKRLTKAAAASDMCMTRILEKV